MINIFRVLQDLMWGVYELTTRILTVIRYNQLCTLLPMSLPTSPLRTSQLLRDSYYQITNTTQLLQSNRTIITDHYNTDYPLRFRLQ